MNKVIVLLLSICTFSSYAFDVTHEMGVASFESPPQNVIALDWGLAETVLSLGVQPIGVADAAGYRQWVVEPTLPQAVTDVGSRREPNLELLTELKPDVILISKHMAAAYAQLNKIAPVLVYTLYDDQRAPLQAAQSATRSLGLLLDKQAQAEHVIEQTKQRLTANGDKVRMAGAADKPLLFVRFINDKTLRIHSQGSLADATIRAMGLKNDWQEATNLWGFTTTGIAKVAEHQHSRVMIFGPLEPTAHQQLTQSPLWQAMAFTRSDSVYELPAIWTFGGLIAAQRFSDHITQQLIGQ